MYIILNRLYSDEKDLKTQKNHVNSSETPRKRETTYYNNLLYIVDRGLAVRRDAVFEFRSLCVFWPMRPAVSSA